jgi:pimeloyl-ACP methyl ester carboxylesterase
MPRLSKVFACFAVWLFAGCATQLQRQFLFFPSHHCETNGLAEWRDGGRLIGFAREVAERENVWLLLHGNGGQAADRVYALPRFAERDAVFILEYPGYGRRSGKPSRGTIDQAAVAAYQSLRHRFPGKPVCVAGESIGSGPACLLAGQPVPPDKIVLLVPFDSLKRVAEDRVRWLPAAEMLGALWDNSVALAGYRGPVEIFAARDDTIIPVGHARALAASVPGARLQVFAGGHNEWSQQRAIAIRNR